MTQLILRQNSINLIIYWPKQRYSSYSYKRSYKSIFSVFNYKYKYKLQRVIQRIACGACDKYPILLSVRPFPSVALLSLAWGSFVSQRDPTTTCTRVPFFIDWPRLTHQEGCIIQELLKVVAACLTKYLPTGTFCQRSQASR